MKKKVTLTLEDYWSGGGDLQLEVNEGFAMQIASNADGKIKRAKLTVKRKPDKHSTRIGMYSYLYNHEKDYEDFGFPSVSLTVDTYSDAGKFVSRKIYDFPSAKVESSFVRGNDEELTFVSNTMKEFEVSEIEVFFD
jgi:hypothetical protein